MVKQINVYFDEDEYKELLKRKNNLSWHDFILKLVKNQNKSKNKKLQNRAN